jgi:hypothetical protein
LSRHGIVGLVLAVLVVAGMAPAALSDEPPPTCNGLAATIVGDDDGDGIIHGTEGDDVIVGTFQGEKIVAGLGNDTVCSLQGDDTVVTGEGNDYIEAGTGDDLVRAGADDDVVLGGYDDDDLRGGWGADTLLGGAGNDLVNGQGGHDTLLGQAHNDRLYGKEGNDDINGGKHSDRIYAGDGENVFSGGTGYDLCKGSGERTKCESRPHEWDPEEWRDLVAEYFDPLGETENALLIMECESGGYPFAQHPVTRASGLFQFVESTWDWVAGMSPQTPLWDEGRYDPVHNTLNASKLVAWSIEFPEHNPLGPWHHWAPCIHVLP